MGCDPGTGHRLAIGWFTLIVDIILLITVPILLYARRDHQPLKSFSPSLLGLVLLHKIPALFWVDLRELGFVTLRCDQMLWVAMLTLIVYVVPLVVFAYRLQLIVSYEAKKVLFAMNQLQGNKSTGARLSAPAVVVVSSDTATAAAASHKSTPSIGGSTAFSSTTAAGGVAPDMTVSHSTLRLYLFTAALLVPTFICLPIFLHYDTSTDWSHAGCCSYYNRDVYLWGAMFFVVSIVVVYVQRQFAKLPALADSYGIRYHTTRTRVYANLASVTFVIWNVLQPDVNETWFETGLIGWIAGTVTIVHLLVYTSLRTWTFGKVDAGAKAKYKALKTVGSAGTPGSGGTPIRAKKNGANHNREVSRIQSTIHSTTSNVYSAPNPNHPLMKVLTDELGYANFLTYAQSEFAAENVLLWKSVELFRVKPTVDAATGLYSTFISSNAVLQVNLSHDIRQEIESRLAPLFEAIESGTPIPAYFTPAPTAGPGMNGAAANSARDGAAAEMKASVDAATTAVSAPPVASTNNSSGGGGVIARRVSLRQSQSSLAIPGAIPASSSGGAATSARPSALTIGPGNAASPVIVATPASPHSSTVAGGSSGATETAPLLTGAMIVPLSPLPNAGGGVTGGILKRTTTNWGGAANSNTPTARAAGGGGADDTKLDPATTTNTGPNTGTVASALTDAYNTPFANVFDDAAREVFGVIAHDSFPRFKVHPLGQAVVSLWGAAAGGTSPLNRAATFNQLMKPNPHAASPVAAASGATPTAAPAITATP